MKKCSDDTDAALQVFDKAYGEHCFVCYGFVDTNNSFRAIHMHLDSFSFLVSNRASSVKMVSAHIMSGADEGRVCQSATSEPGCQSHDMGACVQVVQEVRRLDPRDDNEKWIPL